MDKVTALKSQVDGVKQIMTQNVDRILARGERLDDLMDKSEDLQAGVRAKRNTLDLFTMPQKRIKAE